MKAGSFSGPVRCEWPEGEPRIVVITSALRYTDSRGRVWEAKPGAVADGASIPRLCWLFVGSPFVGLYRRASVIHDVYCDTQSRPWKAVHRVFHEMMLADGVPMVKAYAMGRAVWFGGPRW